MTAKFKPGTKMAAVAEAIRAAPDNLIFSAQSAARLAGGEVSYMDAMNAIVRMLNKGEVIRWGWGFEGEAPRNRSSRKLFKRAATAGVVEGAEQ